MEQTCSSKQCVADLSDTQRVIAELYNSLRHGWHPCPDVLMVFRAVRSGAKQSFFTHKMQERPELNRQEKYKHQQQPASNKTIPCSGQQVFLSTFNCIGCPNRKRVKKRKGMFPGLSMCFPLEAWIILFCFLLKNGMSPFRLCPNFCQYQSTFFYEYLGFYYLAHSLTFYILSRNIYCQQFGLQIRNLQHSQQQGARFKMKMR